MVEDFIERFGEAGEKSAEYEQLVEQRNYCAEKLACFVDKNKRDFLGGGGW